MWSRFDVDGEWVLAGTAQDLLHASSVERAFETCQRRDTRWPLMIAPPGEVRCSHRIACETLHLTIDHR